MTVTPSYIPGPGQTAQQAATRAAALGVGIAPRAVPPVYASAATNLPGVVAEYGVVVFAHDDGTLTAQQVSNLIAPLVAQQTADQAQQDTVRQVAQALANDLANMQAILDTADLGSGTLSSAVLSTAARQLQTAAKAEATAIRHILRYLTATYDGVN